MKISSYIEEIESIQRVHNRVTEKYGKNEVSKYMALGGLQSIISLAIRDDDIDSEDFIKIHEICEQIEFNIRK